MKSLLITTCLLIGFTFTKAQTEASLETENQTKTEAQKIVENIFNSDPNKKDVVVKFINQSECELEIKINGENLYNLTVPANGENSILVDKGNYNVSTTVCNALYNSNKSFSDTTFITLNTPK